MKKLLSMLLAMAMTLCLGSGALGASEPDTTAEPRLTELAVSLDGEPETLDPALNNAVSHASIICHLFAGLARWGLDDDGTLTIEPDCAVELPEGVVNDDGTVTYTYVLKDGLKWSDGQPLSAADFVYAWGRAASAGLDAPYRYLFQVIDGYAGGELNVKAPNETTLEVTLTGYTPYWNELLAFPVLFPVREDVAANADWASDASTFVGNGPYTLAGWEHGSLITLEKDPGYHDAVSVTLDKIAFHLAKDTGEMLEKYESGVCQMVDGVPDGDIQRVEAAYPDAFHTVSLMGTVYMTWNADQELLPAGCALAGAEAETARAEIRGAISLLADRSYICDEISRGGETPASSLVPKGMTDADGSQFYENAGSGRDAAFTGYFDASGTAAAANRQQAVETLKKYYAYDEGAGKFTDFPTLTVLCDSRFKDVCQYLQTVCGEIGVTLTLDERDEAGYLDGLGTGDFSLCAGGWIADYNDPISFLDMWITSSGNNTARLGGALSNEAVWDMDLTGYGYDVQVENGTWANTYDVLIPTIKSCADPEVRYHLMHLAEDMLMASGCVMPLYYYSDVYMLDTHVQGFFINPLGCKYFMNVTIAE